jgi:hypothetical protein
MEFNAKIDASELTMNSDQATRQQQQTLAVLERTVAESSQQAGVVEDSGFLQMKDVRVKTRLSKATINRKSVNTLTE